VSVPNYALESAEWEDAGWSGRDRTIMPGSSNVSASRSCHGLRGWFVLPLVEMRVEQQESRSEKWYYRLLYEVRLP
jgi:hypothetical protein